MPINKSIFNEEIITQLRKSSACCDDAYLWCFLSSAQVEHSLEGLDCGMKKDLGGISMIKFKPSKQ